MHCRLPLQLLRPQLRKWQHGRHVPAAGLAVVHEAGKGSHFVLRAVLAVAGVLEGWHAGGLLEDVQRSLLQLVAYTPTPCQPAEAAIALLVCCPLQPEWPCFAGVIESAFRAAAWQGSRQEGQAVADADRRPIQSDSCDHL